MSADKKPAKNQVGDELVLTKALGAPRDLVFRAWTDPKHLAAWWGPDNFTSTIIAWSAVPGSPLRIDMHAPNGTVYPMSGKFVEVVKPERIVFANTAKDPAGTPLFDILTTVTLAEDGARTRLTLVARITGMTDQAAPYLDGMEIGWTQSLGRLSNCVLGLLRKR
jgi:uncharacterized protein YndB with AHSA1/START domain